MSRRYVYDRIDHLELSRRLDRLGISARELARASGANEDRVLKWLDGREDIPPHIDLLTTLWMRVPGVGGEISDWILATVHDRRVDG